MEQPRAGCLGLVEGEPGLPSALERLICDVRALDGVWGATLDEIARWAGSVLTEIRDVARIEAPVTARS